MLPARWWRVQGEADAFPYPFATGFGPPVMPPR